MKLVFASLPEAGAVMNAPLLDRHSEQIAGVQTGYDRAAEDFRNFPVVIAFDAAVFGASRPCDVRYRTESIQSMKRS